MDEDNINESGENPEVLDAQNETQSPEVDTPEESVTQPSSGVGRDIEALRHAGKLLYDPESRQKRKVNEVANKTSVDEEEKTSDDSDTKKDDLEKKEDKKEEESKKEDTSKSDNKKNTRNGAAKNSKAQGKGDLKKKILKFLAKHSWLLIVLLVLMAIIFLILILAMTASYLDENDNNGEFAQVCDFNTSKVNLDICDRTRGQVITLGDYIVGTATKMREEYGLNDEALKAFMIVLKTNALGNGEYNNDDKEIDASTCDYPFTRVYDEEVGNLYEEIHTDLYLLETYEGVLESLDSSVVLDLSDSVIAEFSSSGGTYEEILDNYYNAILEKIYKAQAEAKGIEYNPDDYDFYYVYDLNDNCGKSSVSPSGSSIICEPMSLNSTTLSREEFIEKTQSYYNGKYYKGDSLQVFADKAGTIYDIATNNGINPEVVLSRAQVEGYSPGGSTNNYWGISCYNGVSGSCASYSSFDKGVEAFVENVSQYSSLTYMLSKYAYIGDYWYSGDTNWGLGGCTYFEYIKQYMSEERQATVEEACKGTTCTKTNTSSCVATTDEDQDAYAQYQASKMTDARETVLGLTADTCEATTNSSGASIGTSGQCELWDQGDSKWGDIMMGGVISVRDAGCAVTSVAMGIACSGTELGVSSFDPGVLVNAFNSAGCLGSGNISWGCSALSSLAPNVQFVGKIGPGYNNPSLSIERQNEILNQYSGNYFFLIHIPYDDLHPSGHYMYAYGVSGDNYLTKDPGPNIHFDSWPMSKVNQIIVYSY